MVSTTPVLLFCLLVGLCLSCTVPAARAAQEEETAASVAAEQECDVRMNGECFDDLEEALHAVNIGRQAPKPKTPAEVAAGGGRTWSRKKIVLELKSGVTHKGSFVLRPDRDLKSILITSVGLGRAIIDCQLNGKPGLMIENRVNKTNIRGLDVRRCSPALHFTKNFEGNAIEIERCNFHGSQPEPVYKTLSLLIDSDHTFDHPSNGAPLRYTDSEIRAMWDSGANGLTEFPMQLAREDEGEVPRLSVVARSCNFEETLHEDGYFPPLADGMLSWDNGLDYYLNRIYKKVGVKTDADKLKDKRTHMYTQRRIKGAGFKCNWDLQPPFRPNEVDHNSPSFRRSLSGNGFY